MTEGEAPLKLFNIYQSIIVAIKESRGATCDRKITNPRDSVRRYCDEINEMKPFTRKDKIGKIIIKQIICSTARCESINSIIINSHF